MDKICKIIEKNFNELKAWYNCQAKYELVDEQALYQEAWEQLVNQEKGYYRYELGKLYSKSGIPETFLFSDLKIK